MKNTNMKKLITAFAAVFAFIGVNNTTAEAITIDYRVIKGDTLWELSQKYGVTIDSIKAENALSNDLILIDEILQIPEPLTTVLPLSTDQLIKADQPIEHEAEKEEETAEPAISLSNEEKDLLARLVEAEAKGESYEGKVAVATVVLNRLESPEFPDSVTDVIHEVVGYAYAFTPVQNGEIKKPASDDSKRAVDEALTRNDTLDDAIYFYNPEIATDTWILTREAVTTVGNHVFAK